MPQVNITPRQVKAIKVMARRVFGSDDDAYREMLRAHGRVESCKDLQGPRIDLVIRHLQRCLGQGGKQSAASRQHSADKTENQPLMATEAQLKEIRGRWDRVSRAPAAGREQALRHFLWKRFKVSALEFLTLRRAQQVIEGLKAMAARAPQ